MSYIPDCRADEHYNEKYLDEKNRLVIKGFDWCTENVVDRYFENIEDTIESDHLMTMLNQELPENMKGEYEMEDTFSRVGEVGIEKRTVNTYKDYLRMCLLQSCEMERNELIANMLDAMEDEEYNAIKEAVDGQSQEEIGQRTGKDGEADS